MLRCTVRENPETWDEHLPQLSSAMRSAENRQTGFSANRMMLGREVIQPYELMMGTAEVNSSETSPADYVQKLGMTLSKVHDAARKNLQTALLRQKHDYDIKLKVIPYQFGDLVYKIDSASRVGQSSKLRPVWKGPYLVVKVISDNLYCIRDRKHVSVIHHDRLKLCKDRVVPQWMKKLRHNLLCPEKDEIESTSVPVPDSDLNLDLLFWEESDGSVAGSDVVDHSGEDTQVDVQDTVNTQVGDYNSVTSDDSDVQGATVAGSRSRRSRRVRTPGYLRDYST